MKLALTIEVNYDANLVPEEVLRCILSRAAIRLANEGLLTGSTDAEVKGWLYEIRRLD